MKWKLPSKTWKYREQELISLLYISWVEPKPPKKQKDTKYQEWETVKKNVKHNKQKWSFKIRIIFDLHAFIKWFYNLHIFYNLPFTIFSTIITEKTQTPGETYIFHVCYSWQIQVTLEYISEVKHNKLQKETTKTKCLHDRHVLKGARFTLLIIDTIGYVLWFVWQKICFVDYMNVVCYSWQLQSIWKIRNKSNITNYRRILQQDNLGLACFNPCFNSLISNVIWVVIVWFCIMEKKKHANRLYVTFDQFKLLQQILDKSNITNYYIVFKPDNFIVSILLMALFLL